MLKIEVKHDLKNNKNITRYSCSYCGNPLDKYCDELLNMKDCPICRKNLENNKIFLK